MRRILLLPVLALVAMMFIAAPASAATVDSFTLDGGTDDVTVTLGESVVVAWEVSPEDGGEVDVTAAGSAATNPNTPEWTGLVTSPTTVTPTETGTYTFQIAAVEGLDLTPSDTITVTVVAADEGLVPAPVTFPDACTVSVPTTEGVRYVVDFGDGDVEDAFPGTLPVVAYYNDGAPVTFRAEPREGVTFDLDAPTEWTTTPSEECFGQAADLVSTSVGCGTVEFTNLTDQTVALFYGNPDEDDEPGIDEIDPGGSTVVSTDLEELFFVASTGADNPAGLAFENGDLEVPQDCADGDGAAGTASHPTVAPAAGADQASSAGATGALAALAVLGAAVVGGRRLLRSA